MRNRQKGKFTFRTIKAVLCLTLAFIIMGAFVPADVSAASFSTSGKVQGMKVSQVAFNSVTLSWNKYKNATGYQVYRATKKNGKYSRIKTTSQKSYKRTNLTTNKTCYYKVRAYYGTGSKRKYSKYSAIVSGKPVMTKPVIGAVPAGSGVFVSWKAVDGAGGYKVYRSTSRDGKYSLIRTTGSTSYTDTSVTAGRTYYYKVRAYRVIRGSTKYSIYSSVRSSMSAPGKTRITAKQNGNAIEISWKASAGAEGYEVYRATDYKGKYEAIGETTALVYRDTSVEDGVTYYYKVKAYINVGTNRIFGDCLMGKYSRDEVVKYAKAWLGYSEKSGKYKEIIDVYNACKPLPQGYRMKYSDHWCAAYVSAVAIKAGTTPIMHRECSCNRMIKLYQASNDWVENDAYVPAHGDIIFYDWDDGKNYSGDNRGGSEHVGIVTAISADNVTTVIEGNKADTVGYRTIKVNGRYIRGYGTPKYDAASGVTFVKQVPENDTGVIMLSMGGDFIEMEESEEVVDSYEGHLNRIKKNTAGLSSENEKMEFILQYVRERMAPEADEQDLSAYYARLVYDICAELGITATIDSVPDANGMLYSTNVVILDDKAYTVDASKNLKIEAYELED